MKNRPLYERIPLYLYNSLSRSKERFEPIEKPHVGMYVCGPTVYSDPHLGHARTAIAFDIVFRYLRFLGYKVRYVRNITDVGHLEDEQAGTGEDRIAKRARLEQVEPMEVVQRYTLSYHDGMRRCGCLPPSIEPRATGHIIEQIEVVERILEAGLAYVEDGSVYFDLDRYVHAGEEIEGAPYGTLSGRVFEDLLANTRDTTGTEEKRNPLDFALWKRAEPTHIMHWASPWGEGFPGWHVECTTMSTRYLGERFDIHGGGLDLQFPHHEAEIAQNHAAFGSDPARYWMHSNMLTVDGQKMARSLGNFITLDQIFAGDHPRLDRAFDPMVLRFFSLQSHYRSMVDFSNEALEAAERGYERLIVGLERAEEFLAAVDAQPAGSETDTALERILPLDSLDSKNPEHAAEVQIAAIWEAMSDDFHTPRAIAALFELARIMGREGWSGLQESSRVRAARCYRDTVREVLGLAPTTAGDGAVGADSDLTAGLVALLLEMRAEARAAKDFARADAVRDRLAALGVQIEDARDGSSTWSIKR